MLRGKKKRRGDPVFRIRVAGRYGDPTIIIRRQCRGEQDQESIFEIDFDGDLSTACIDYPISGAEHLSLSDVPQQIQARAKALAALYGCYRTLPF
jgi:hypothetical protein